MKRFFFCLFFSFIGLSLWAQSFEPYIPEDEMPDVVQVLPAPPQDPSSEFDRDIMRYMWGKQQRRDPARLEMAVRDAIWSMDTTLVILGEHFGLKISREETPAIYEVLTRGITTIENIRFRPKAHYFRIRPFAYFKEPSIFPQDDEWLSGEGSYHQGMGMRPSDGSDQSRFGRSRLCKGMALRRKPRHLRLPLAKRRGCQPPRCRHRLLPSSEFREIPIRHGTRPGRIPPSEECREVIEMKLCGRFFVGHKAFSG